LQIVTILSQFRPHTNNRIDQYNQYVNIDSAWLAQELLYQSTKSKKQIAQRRDSDMFKFKETFDRLMAAITFAQANEHEIALDIMHDRPERDSRKRVDAHIRRSEETRPQMRI